MFSLALVAREVKIILRVPPCQKGLETQLYVMGSNFVRRYKRMEVQNQTSALHRLI